VEPDFIGGGLKSKLLKADKRPGLGRVGESSAKDENPDKRLAKLKGSLRFSFVAGWPYWLIMEVVASSAAAERQECEIDGRCGGSSQNIPFSRFKVDSTGVANR
jgi:hypothetical protein